MKNILEDNVNTQAQNIVLGALCPDDQCPTNCLPVEICQLDLGCRDDLCPLNCGTGDKICVNDGTCTLRDLITGCTEDNSNECPTHTLCDSYNPDPCLDGGVVTGCTTNYVYSDCSTDAIIVTRGMFNSKINDLTFFTEEITRIATKGDIDKKTSVNASFKIKDDYKSFQGVRLRDIGILCILDILN